ncbi:helix-turn-helix transcriptional regulator [Acidithiobacillus sp. M4-SHS-6]|uniref:helix-turn-helix transcriptional regulator n=1 Tax=Acidithiobacillus sp. M4-SHS-6 TaxID=3383024 RepID=UPI0039BDD9B7
MDSLLTIHDLARILRVSHRTLQNRKPEDLPPSITLPGTKRARRWRERDVTQWLLGLPTSNPVSANSSVRRPGRPRRVV